MRSKFKDGIRGMFKIEETRKCKICEDDIKKKTHVGLCDCEHGFDFC